MIAVSAPKELALAYVVLTGNPNCGKTTLFNALTGLRAKVGNYAGVTVERKEGRMQGLPRERRVTLLDLPGTYSLSPHSLDEKISRDVLFRQLPEVPPPAVVVIVVDASNLQRNLYYATQVLELGYPAVVALNMMDVAQQNGEQIDAQALARELGVPVLPLVASQGRGLNELKSAILEQLDRGSADAPIFARLPAMFIQEIDAVADCLHRAGQPQARRSEALLMISDDQALELAPSTARPAVLAARQRLETEGIDWRALPIEARYARAAELHQSVVTRSQIARESFSDKLDRVLTHKLWGLLIFIGIMALMFQSIFSVAEYPMTWLENGVAWLGEKTGSGVIALDAAVSGWTGGPAAGAEGDLHSLLVDGIIAGVGAVVVFLPQICLLFLFIGLLEDTGYMARAAFLMDRLMSKVGLHGKSFIPMLSSFACAIPGIMATRTIESPKDRLVTILIAPLMSCSARLPVYTVLIAACIPSHKKVLGVLNLSGVTMLAMYLLGIAGALAMAWLLKKSLLRGQPPLLIMELPPYKRPVPSVLLRHMWDRSQIFLRRAGTVILGISILLWFLATYPKTDSVIASAKSHSITEQTRIDLDPTQETSETAGVRLRNSFAGRLGQWIEPVIAPLGFDWKIGIGIVASFAAREVFVSTMSTVYNVGEFSDTDEGTKTLAQTLREQVRPDGTPVYTPLVAVTLMVFYVFALQCVSTVAVVRRETNSWKWPLFQWTYMGVLAWTMAFLCYQGGRWLGLQ